MSHYNPALGGVNCARFVNGECVSKMSNGEKWQDWIDKNVVACPPDFAFESIFVVEGESYICKDRGSAIIRTDDGKIWLDVLTSNPKYYFGEEIEAVLFDE